MDNNHLVSILTPCYNTEKYLNSYIDKIIKQTYDNIEIVFINDGSTDNTEKLIKNGIKKLEKRGFKVIYKKKENGGLGSAINLGLKLMTGEFFCWLDCDNFYEDTYVEKNVKVFLDNPSCNVVRCDGCLYYEDDMKKPYAYFSDGNTDKYQKKLFMNAIVEKNFHFGCAMIRTSAFDKVVKGRDIYESRQGQNWQLLLPMFYYYDSYYIDEKLFNYIYTRGSITSQNHNNMEKRLLAQNEHEKILLETIKRMNIKDARYYNGIIKRKYILRRIMIAEEFKDEELINKEKDNLKKFDKLSNRIKYFVLFPKYRKIK